MADDWPTRFTRHAQEMVDAFIADHSEYTRDEIEQPSQGATNRVIFACRGEERVVFKVFCTEERKQRECFGLKHWQATGLVPWLIWEESADMILMSHIPGQGLSGKDDAAACEAAGRAAGELTLVALDEEKRRQFESQFYEGLGSLEAYLNRVLELGSSIHHLDPDFRDSFWGENLAFIADQAEALRSQPQNLYHQDMGNLHVVGNRFSGFFDLEMCRVGGPALQLASAMFMFRGTPERWERFCAGWRAGAKTDLGLAERRAAAAAAHVLAWREISRYMSYDGTPGSGYSWASPAESGEYRRIMSQINHMLSGPHSRTREPW